MYGGRCWGPGAPTRKESRSARTRVRVRFSSRVCRTSWARAVSSSAGVR
ncbi:DUF2690 domain-containing protein [Streptomyces sp. A1499]|nr:DUF2690 domain-containing protein [Streptomyces sp. A1499]